MTSQDVACSALEGPETRLFAKFIVSAAAAAAAYALTMLMFLILLVCEMARLQQRWPLGRVLRKKERKMAPKAIWNTRIQRDVPWSSTLLEELLFKRKERLFNLGTTYQFPIELCSITTSIFTRSIKQIIITHIIILCYQLIDRCFTIDRK